LASTPKKIIQIPTLQLQQISKDQHIQFFDMEHFGINTQDNYPNSYLAALFSNGQMMECEDGVKFECESSKLFRTPENCTFNMLSLKVCSTLEVPSTTSISTLYFRRPTL